MTVPPAATHLADRRPLTIGLVMMITVAAFEALAVATVMPAVKDELGGVALYGWAFSSFLLASLVGITFAGEQADRHGPARPFAVGLGLFTVGLAIGGLAPAMWVLVIGRAVRDSARGDPPVAYVAVARAYPDDARARMFALFATAWVVPGLVGPGLAGVTAEYLTWRLVFLGILPLVGAAALLTLPALRQLGAPPKVASPADVRSRMPTALMVAAGAGMFLAGLTVASPWLTPPLLLGGAIVATPALRRLMPAGTFSAGRGLPATVLGIAALNLAFFGTDAFVPLMLTDVRDQSTVFVGAIFTASTLCWTAGTWTVERTKDRVSRPAFVATGLVLVALGTLGQIFVLNESVPVWFAGITWSIGAFGIGVAYPSFSLLLLAQAPVENEGSVTSAAKLAEALAAAVGAGVVGAIVTAGESSGELPMALGLSFALMAGVAALGALLAQRLPGSSPSQPEAVQALATAEA
jgi:MFS family permease